MLNLRHFGVILFFLLTPIYSVDMVKVARGDGFSGFGYYGISPESPDGTRVVYIQFHKPPTSLKEWCPASLMICDSDFNNHRVLMDIPEVRTHNTAMAVWIDNTYIAYESRYQTYIIDANSGELKWGPLKGTLNHYAYNGKILISIDKGDDHTRRGLYEFDSYTGSMRLVVSHDHLLSTFKGRLKDAEESLGVWKIQHGQYSPDGEMIAFKFMNFTADEKSFITCSIEGDNFTFTNDKPLHFQWLDNTTLLGHDSLVKEDRLLKQWSPIGEIIDTIAGTGNHPAVSPNGKLLVSESWYREEDISLFLYQYGSVTPLLTIPLGHYPNVVWELKAHINPSFSRDGKRIYFNRPVSDGLSQAYSIDITHWKREYD